MKDIRCMVGLHRMRDGFSTCNCAFTWRGRYCLRCDHGYSFPDEHGHRGRLSEAVVEDGVATIRNGNVTVQMW